MLGWKRPAQKTKTHPVLTFGFSLQTLHPFGGWIVSVHDRQVELCLGLALKMAWLQCEPWSGLNCVISSPTIFLLNIWILAFWLDNLVGQLARKAFFGLILVAERLQVSTRRTWPRTSMWPLVHWSLGFVLLMASGWDFYILSTAGLCPCLSLQDLTNSFQIENVWAHESFLPLSLPFESRPCQFLKIVIICLPIVSLPLCRRGAGKPTAGAGGSFITISALGLTLQSDWAEFRGLCWG